VHCVRCVQVYASRTQAAADLGSLPTPSIEKLTKMLGRRLATLLLAAKVRFGLTVSFTAIATPLVISVGICAHCIRLLLCVPHVGTVPRVEVVARGPVPQWDVSNEQGGSG
jgi:hypothetical protein